MALLDHDYAKYHRLISPTPINKKNRCFSKINCCVCKMHGYRHVEGHGKISYHTFPSINDPLRKKWLLNITGDENSEFTIKQHTSICSLHFKPELREVHGFSGKRTLVPGAVPTEFEEGELIIKKRPRRSSTKMSHCDSISQCTTKDNSVKDNIGDEVLGNSTTSDRIKLENISEEKVDMGNKRKRKKVKKTTDNEKTTYSKDDCEQAIMTTRQGKIKLNFKPKVSRKSFKESMGDEVLQNSTTSDAVKLENTSEEKVAMSNIRQRKKLKQITGYCKQAIKTKRNREMIKFNFKSKGSKKLKKTIADEKSPSSTNKCKPRRNTKRNPEVKSNIKSKGSRQLKKTIVDEKSSSSTNKCKPRRNTKRDPEVKSNIKSKGSRQLKKTIVDEKSSSSTNKCKPRRNTKRDPEVKSNIKSKGSRQKNAKSKDFSCQSGISYIHGLEMDTKDASTSCDFSMNSNTEFCVNCCINPIIKQPPPLYSTGDNYYVKTENGEIINTFQMQTSSSVNFNPDGLNINMLDDNSVSVKIEPVDFFEENQVEESFLNIYETEETNMETNSPDCVPIQLVPNYYQENQQITNTAIVTNPMLTDCSLNKEVDPEYSVQNDSLHIAEETCFNLSDENFVVIKNESFDPT